MMQEKLSGNSGQDYLSIPEGFASHVRHALANLYDPGHLRTSPLVDWLGLRAGAESTSLLREALHEAIESLRPDSSIPFGRPEWLGYRLLFLTYVRGVQRAAVCAELGISRTSFYRRHQEAVEAAARALWEGHSRGASPAMPAPTSENIPPLVSDEAARVAQETPREPVRLREVLHSAVSLVKPAATAQGVPLEIDAPAVLPLAYADPALLRQALLNLLSEGLKVAAPSGLVLAVRVVASETLWCLHGLQGDPVAAKGMEQTPGYLVSQALLKAYGGRLWHERAPDGTLRLFFTLPIARPKTILIIDDDGDTMRLYRRYLQEQDYAVREARSAAEARVQIEAEEPDLILLDVLMPREDGWDILNELKAHRVTAHIPVVICSVLSQPNMALALGATEVLCKPIDEAGLVRTVAAVLARQGSAG
jgi:CheY-like chemotaxis protein